MPSRDGGAEREVSRPHARGQRCVDVLQVHVDDPLGMGGGEGHRIRAPDQQVTGVDAEPDPRPGEDALGLLARLDHGPDVGVQRRHHTAGPGTVRDPVEVAEQDGPAGIVQLGPVVVPVDAGEGRQHHDAGTDTRRSASMKRFTSGSGSWPGSWSSSGRKPPTAWRPYDASWSALAAGSASRNPSGPNSVAARPSSRICVSTVSAASWKPHPGTSHTPHEIGAPATRRRTDGWPSGLSGSVLVLSCVTGEIVVTVRLTCQ